MGKLGKSNWSKENWLRFRNSKPILSYSIIFLVVFFGLISAPSIIKNIPNNIFILIANSAIDRYCNGQVNSKANALYNYDELSQKAEFVATYNQYLPANLSGQQKVIAVNINLEYYLPITLLFSFIIAFNTKLKDKILKLLIGEFILFLYLTFKIIAVAFDNYNYPESAIIEINGIFGGMVYYFSSLLNVVGNSPNFILPLIICVVIFYKELGKYLS